MKKTFLVVLFLVCSFTIMNPGVLISVTFPYSPPVVNLPLPFPINDVLVSNLELTTVELRQVDYTWKLTAPKVDVNVTRAVVSFDWFYKKDSGKGFFIQDELQLIFDWNFNITKDSRFQIGITNTKIRPGKMKVELGGGVIETVAIEVTNLILNRASIVFRGIIANKLSSAITNASTVLGKDILLYHDKDRNKDLKLNTTLVAAPFITNQTLFIQVNAAPFIQGQSSGFLNPPDVLTKSNSTKIQVQVHKLMLTKILELVMRIRGDIFVEFQTSSITSVIDIDSLALSPVFPPMAFFPQNRDVVFSVGIPTVTFDFSNQNFLVKFRGQCTVSTQQKFGKVRNLYMNPINVSASVELAVIFGPVVSNIRIQKMQVLSFNPDKQDIDSKLVIPEQLSRNFVELMDWVTQAVNFELNHRVLRLNYQNIIVIIKGKVIYQRSYNLQLDLK